MSPFHSTRHRFTSLLLIAFLMPTGCHDSGDDVGDELKGQIERLERKVERLELTGSDCPTPSHAD